MKKTRQSKTNKTKPEERPSNQLSPEESAQLMKDWNELRAKYPGPDTTIPGVWSTWASSVTSWGP